MAFLFNDPNDEERKKQGQPSQIAGAGGGGPGDGAAPAEQAGPDRQFTDVGAYLDANRPQTADLSQKVVGQINNDATKLRGDIDSSSSDFSRRVNEGKVSYDGGLVDSALSNPSEFVKDTANVGKFSKQRDASYAGPVNFSELNPDLAGRVKSSAEEAKGVETTAGRKAMLQRLYPSSTAGQVSLDEMLIGGNADARRDMGQAAQQFGAVNDYLEQAAGRSNTAADAAKKETEATRKTVASRFDSALPTFEHDLDTRTAAARTAATTRGSDLAKIIASRGQLSEADAAALGLTPQQWAELNKSAEALKTDWRRDVPLDPFVSSKNADVEINRGNVASTDDYAREAALEQLSGGQLNILNNDEAGNAGKAPGSLSHFDIESALANVGGDLSGRDTQFLDTYRDTPPGIPGTVRTMPQGNAYSQYNDEDFYKLAKSVFGRNADHISPLQKQWLETYGPVIGAVPWNGTGTPPPVVELPHGTPDPTTADGTADNYNGPLARSYRVKPGGGGWEYEDPQTGQWLPWTGPPPNVSGRMGGGAGVY